MKHQYESEILFRLMERDGFNIPSSVPPYESEIKAYLINQVKLAYPKLTDYEAEWLLYNYTKHLPADFPISSATNVTNATFENVVPFAYQSAILKGDTESIIDRFENGSYNNNFEKVGSDGTRIRLINPITNITNFSITLNDGFQVLCWIKKNDGTVSGSSWSANTNLTLKITDQLVFAIKKSDNSSIIYEEVIQAVNSTSYKNLTELKSVKMPVLTTTGKNLFDGKFELGTISSANGVFTSVTTAIRAKNYTEVKGDTRYVMYIGSDYKMAVVCYDENKQFLKTLGTYPSSSIFHLTEDVKYIKLRTPDKLGMNDVNVEVSLYEYETGINVSYEPFKSNILTVNEEVELRGIGEVQDTLDCLTGEVVERVGKIVLDGSEDWSSNALLDNGIRVYMCQTHTNGKSSTNNVIGDTIPFYTLNYLKGLTTLDKLSNVFLTTTTSTGKLNLGFKTSFSTLDQLKLWLSQNPITVQYPLKTESVKTVDLKTVNESGESVHFMPFEGTMHVQSSGEPIQPSFDMSVPVEATTQNLASFIDLEMEE